MTYIEQAHDLLTRFKGSGYHYGPGVLDKCGPVAAGLGRKAALIRSTFSGSERFVAEIGDSLNRAGIDLVATIAGPKPNVPLEDLRRITGELKAARPDVVVSFGGGSAIDAAKAAIVLATLGGDIDEYFGTGLVTEALKRTGKKLTPHVAIQTAASSAAHLTKYSNITNIATGQKKLIIDEAIVPTRALFDYSVTYSSPPALTEDGALDGISHCLEVLYSAVGKSNYDLVERVSVAGIAIIVNNLESAVRGSGDARNALCLATDLGGYAIMLGGTNGAHLNSFSFVDILAHGRACGMLNPYYTVFFAPAVEDALKKVAAIYHSAGLARRDIALLSGRQLGAAVAEAMFELARRIGFPTKLNDVPGFTPAHISRALAAAKDPQLKSKLENMPVPLTAEMVDEYMGSVLAAARDGDLSLIKNVPAGKPAPVA
jgi:alcohol dehydrogenase